MQILYTALILLLMVGATRLSAHLIPIPLPLIQVVVGALLAWPTLGLHVALDPELFLLLFIPALLFSDGWRMPKREFWRLRRPIFVLAFGLVFLTVLGAGWFLHWMLHLPWAVAFALAAVLSPTDAVAVSSIVRGRLPSALLHVIQGEALLNDASGLVTFKFAVAAALTGAFSLSQASLEFVIVAVGGVLVGGVLSWLVGRARAWMVVKRGWSDAAPHVVFMLLLPFAAYVLAERLGVSGILSAVAAGMMQSRVDMLPRQTATRLLNHSVWGLVEFAFNGLVFLILGLQLPDILAAALPASQALWPAAGWLTLYVLGAYGVIMAIRFGVILGYWHLTQPGSGPMTIAGDPRLIAAIASLSGVRGAVTLAGVLSLPLLLSDGTPFPLRDVLVFIAAGVILLSLVVASIGIPLLLARLPEQSNDLLERERCEVRINAARAAITALEDVESSDADEPARVALQAEIKAGIIAEFRDELSSADDSEDARSLARLRDTLDGELRLLAIRAQRRELYRLRIAGVIDDLVVTEFLRELDIQETALMRDQGNR